MQKTKEVDQAITTYVILPIHSFSSVKNEFRPDGLYLNAECTFVLQAVCKNFRPDNLPLVDAHTGKTAVVMEELLNALREEKALEGLEEKWRAYKKENQTRRAEDDIPTLIAREYVEREDVMGHLTYFRPLPKEYCLEMLACMKKIIKDSEHAKEHPQEPKEEDDLTALQVLLLDAAVWSLVIYGYSAGVLENLFEKKIAKEQR